uniref:Uncharacterized protein n=1 Tax=Streptomyces sp. NBC_00093 TaxID=2975649 RepID=A0AAU2ACZ7_9ACTN
MSTTTELREVRRWLNESRSKLLDAFITVNTAVKENEATAKRQLTERLHELDEFANSTAYEDYRPA